MKTLTAPALAEIAKQYGTEPLSIVEIEWEPGSTSQYADKEVQGIPGKILVIGSVHSVITIENVQSTEVALTLDDTDGAIKTILDNVDVHKRNATVYQYYGDLTLDDKFNVFSGKISTPFTWGEDDRQISLTIISEIENFEVGFSPEEGQLDFVSEDYIGQAWPLAFGHCVHVPAQKVKQIPQARLLDLLTKRDPTLEWKIDKMVYAFNLESFIFSFWGLVVRGANYLAPTATSVLTEYVKVLIEEDLMLIAIGDKTKTMDYVKWACQRWPKDPRPREDLRKLQKELREMAHISNAIILRKEYLEWLTRLVRLKYEMKKKALNEQIKAYNNMLNIYADYLDAWRELCEQVRYERTTVRVQEGEYAGFPDGVPVDVIIKGVRTRVQFDHANSTMDILVLPVNRYDDMVVVRPWVADDEPCIEPHSLDGQDMFRIQNTEHPSLEGLYLLVKKFGTDDRDGFKDRHLIKVRKHKGNKVYFDLVKWDQQRSGQPGGVDLDKYLNKIEETPFINGPFGWIIPGNMFSRQFDPALWARPEAQLLLTLLNTIPGGVNREELSYLAQLVFLAPKEYLMDQLLIAAPTPRDVFTIIGPDVTAVLAASGHPPKNWFYDYRIPEEEIPEDLSWEAQPGANIRPDGPDCELYIANLLPSTVKAVHAYRKNEEGERYLAPVPSRYYIKNESADLGTYQVTSLTFPRTLVEIPSEQWETDIYVTLDSSVGPNVVDTMEWLVNTYTDKTVDAVNFATNKALIQSGGQELYPAHFFLLDRPNVLEELQRIAYESRFALFLTNNKFYLKYLSAEPAADDSITANDVESETLRVEYTSTEQLVTRMIATYNRDGLPLEPGHKQPRFVLRHNVKKYGLHSSNEHFHIYNIPELVLKSATFWMIRRANTWKKVILQTFHTKIRFDTLDTVELNFAQSFFADGAVKGVIEEALYDSSNNTITLSVNTGIKTGEMLQYVHFWPALQDPAITFPTDAEIELGYAGGFGPGQGVIGTIDDCPTEE